MKDTDQDPAQNHRAKGHPAKKAALGNPSATNHAFDLQRTVGNRAVAGAIGSRIVQRKPKDSAGDEKSIQFQVIWTEDRDEFYHRVVAAISRHAGIPESALWQGVNAPAHRLHASLMNNLELRPGQPISITTRVSYSSSAVVADVQELESLAVPRASKDSQKLATPPPSDDDQPKPGETDDQRLRRQAKTTAAVLSTVIADADAEGWASVNIKIEHNGREIVPAFEKLEPKAPRRSGTTPVSADTIRQEHLKPDLDMIVMSGKGIYQIQFGRNPQGRMSFLYFGRYEPPVKGRGMSEREELDALGIPDRRKIYAQIFADANEVLKEQAVQVAGFTAEQIVLWIAGGVILRVLGLLGAGAVRGFPILVRALELERTGDIVRAMASLGEAESGELSTLLEQSQKGRLSGQQLTRLGELLAKVEKTLGLEIPTLRTISRISESPALVREAEAISADAQREVNSLLEQYLRGNTNPGIGTKTLDKGIFYLRGRNGGRIFLREANGYLEILGKADKSNEQTVINVILRDF